LKSPFSDLRAPTDGAAPVEHAPIERGMVLRAMDEAEEHTTHYYCIPPREWQQLRYDLITRQDSEWEPMPEPVLARVQHLERVSPRPKSPLEFYRIQLNDPRILSVARRDNLERSIHAFLVYILTHEMVHLVRLSSILDNRTDFLLPSEEEEERVDRISRQILGSKTCHQFGPVLERFRPLRDSSHHQALFSF
jgi:hypothetical protein